MRLNSKSILNPILARHSHPSALSQPPDLEEQSGQKGSPLFPLPSNDSMVLPREVAVHLIRWLKTQVGLEFDLGSFVCTAHPAAILKDAFNNKGLISRSRTLEKDLIADRKGAGFQANPNTPFCRKGFCDLSNIRALEGRLTSRRGVPGVQRLPHVVSVGKPSVKDLPYFHHPLFYRLGKRRGKVFGAFMVLVGVNCVTVGRSDCIYIVWTSISPFNFETGNSLIQQLI